MMSRNFFFFLLSYSSQQTHVHTANVKTSAAWNCFTQTTRDETSNLQNDYVQNVMSLLHFSLPSSPLLGHVCNSYLKDLAANDSLCACKADRSQSSPDIQISAPHHTHPDVRELHKRVA